MMAANWATNVMIAQRMVGFRILLFLGRRVAHRENALFALVRDIRGDIHQKYNAQYRGDIHEYRGDIHEYRAISRNIA